MSESWCSSLINAGLVREDFVLNIDITDDAFFALSEFEEGYSLAKRNETKTVGSLLINHKLLTSDHVENLIVSGNKNQINSWAKCLGRSPTPELVQLIQHDQLSIPVVCQLLNGGKLADVFPGVSPLDPLRTTVVSGASNCITFGIDRVEFERVKAIICAPSHEQYYYLKQFKKSRYKNGLLEKFGAREHLSSKQKQIEKVIPAQDARSAREQLEDVWQHYAEQSPLFAKISQETPISDMERKGHVASVNNHQCDVFANGNKDLFTNFDERFIDIYGRYNKAEMDPFTLAVIARTVAWYIDKGHSRLFTQARLMSDRIHRSKSGVDSIPFAAYLMNNKMKIFKGTGDAFKNSIFGGNRFFLTQSNAYEASDRGSIPIISLAIWKQTDKFNPRDRYALLRADFDKSDFCRKADDLSSILKQMLAPRDRAASIAAVIEQTLSSLRNVEGQEIARANEAGYLCKSTLSVAKSQNSNQNVSTAPKRTPFSSLGQWRHNERSHQCLE